MLKNKHLIATYTVFTFMVTVVLVLHKQLENKLGEMTASTIVVISIIGLLMYFVPKVKKAEKKIN